MLTFLCADLITGTLREELPLTITQDATRLLMDAGVATLELPTRDPGCPADWLEHTTPWRCLYAAVDERGRILWAGIPVDRIRPPLSSVVTIPCVTLEGYLARRHVPTLTFNDRDQTSEIARALAGIAGDPPGIGLQYDCPDSFVHRDRRYFDDEGVTVLQRLQELGQVIDGFEWTIDVAWSDATQTGFRKVFRTGYPTIGRIASRPNTVFELPGTITGGEYAEEWGSDTAATHVVAVGDGEGESKVMSAPVIDTEREAAGWPRLETRRSFSSVTTQSVIDGHAQAVAGQVFGGQQAITLEVRADQPPYFGEWALGDSVGVKVATSTLDLDEVWRVVGWSLAPGSVGTVKPLVARVTTPYDDEWTW